MTVSPTANRAGPGGEVERGGGAGLRVDVPAVLGLLEAPRRAVQLVHHLPPTTTRGHCLLCTRPLRAHTAKMDTPLTLSMQI